MLTQDTVTYRKDSDPYLGTRRDLMKKAAELGMSPQQARQFHNALGQAETRNATPRGRTLSSLESWTGRQIVNLHRQGAFGSTLAADVSMDETAHASGSIAADVHDQLSAWFSELHASNQPLPSRAQVSARLQELTLPYEDQMTWDLFNGPSVFDPTPTF